MAKYSFRNQFGEEPLKDSEKFHSESPLVPGQALKGSELYRRMQSGLPVGCAIREFNQVNPYLEKFSIYDSIGSYKLRHGMLTKDQIQQSEENVIPSPEGSEPNPPEPQPEA